MWVARTAQLDATMCYVLTVALLVVAGASTLHSFPFSDARRLLSGEVDRLDVRKMKERNGKVSYYRQYALPECSAQQVCNAIYVRLNRIQPMCSCPYEYGSSCSTRVDTNDGHTVSLAADEDGLPLTTVKLCEPIDTVRKCKSPKDWMLLALQSRRTGKAHYLVICQCPFYAHLQGPVKHSVPSYAHIPGINVYGMLCNQGYRKGRQPNRGAPEIPWNLVSKFVNSTNWN